MSTARLEELLRENARKDLLRFSTAGSIDDGKSTLIGRLLHDSKGLYDDHLAAVRKASKGRGVEGELDFSLFTDGLKAEREQGITIDVAYRYFSTPKRKFIIADTPGHEQYTRNMATGASTANLSIVLVDARHGVLPQTRRHAFIAALLGVPHLVLAVNKMDLVGYDRAVFERIKAEFEDFARKLRVVDLRFIPLSALKGDNVVTRSAALPWYEGESLLEVLESVYIGGDLNLVDLRFPVQYVLRPNMDFRGYAGTVASGTLRRGEEVLALPSMRTSRVRSIRTGDGEVDEAFAPMAVVVALEDELDVSRGDMLVRRHNLPRVERHVEAMVVWMDAEPMAAGESYLVKHTTQVTRARVEELRYRVDVNTLARSPAQGLALNEIGRVVLTAHRPLFYDAYERNRATGSFVLVHPVNNRTVAAGMLLDREPAEQLAVRMDAAAGEAAGTALARHESRVTPAERAHRLGQQPATLWITGLAGAGKTELAYEVERRLFDLGAACVVLDGENVRLGLSRGLDFSAEGRAEHLRRAAETARLLNDAGLIAVCAFLSPTRDTRRQVAERVGAARYLEIHLDAPVAWCEARDTRGLYAAARRGEGHALAGVTMPYEPPEAPALAIAADRVPLEAQAAQVIELLRRRGVLRSV